MTLSEFLLQNPIPLGMAVASGAALIYVSMGKGGGSQGLTPAEATQLINRQHAWVLDVRSEGEYSAGHIVNAVHIPLDAFAGRGRELDKLKKRPVVITCTNGARSGKALAQLKKQGFEQIYGLSGGLDAWRKAGLPLVKT